MVDAAIHEARAASGFEHRGLEGRVREILVERMLRPVLSPEIHFGTGKLIDATGALSSETDVILYSPSIMPPGLYDTRTGIFPVESCLYTIEVKSTLQASDVRSAITNARVIQSMAAVQTQYFNGRELVQAVTPRPINAVFGFGTDLSEGGKHEIERLREADPHANTDPAISVFCVAGRGYGYFAGDETGRRWRWTQAPAEKHDEVLSFLAGISNTMPEMLWRKGRPKFGNYLTRDAFDTV